MSAVPRRRALYAAVVVLAFFGGVELLVRATTAALGRASIPDAAIAQHIEGSGLTYDAELGWRSAHGDWRHPEPFDPAPDWRAVAIGDSQTAGAGLSLEQSWPMQTEAALRRSHPDRRLQVLNAAVPGYSSLQALRLMQDHRLGHLRPDAWLIDCRVFDGPRDQQVEPIGVERLLFHWRTWYLLRFAVERARGRTASMRSVPDARTDLGNHAGIAERAAARGEAVLFVDYPVWETGPDQIECHAPPELLPPGVHVARACQALQALGRPASELFFDRNHLRAEGAAVVGQAVADALVALGLGPD